MPHLRVRGKRRNRIHWTETFVKRARRRAVCHKCGRGNPIIGPTLDGVSSTALIRSLGGGVAEVKRKIREGGWLCRKCFQAASPRSPTVHSPPEYSPPRSVLEAARADIKDFFK